MAQSTILDVRGLTKRIGNLVLMEDLNFSLAEGKRSESSLRMERARAHCLTSFAVMKTTKQARLSGDVTFAWGTSAKIHGIPSI